METIAQNANFENRGAAIAFAERLKKIGYDVLGIQHGAVISTVYYTES